jgi:hypothetical protein
MPDNNPFLQRLAFGQSQAKPDAYNPLALGKKHYGSGRSMPNVGPISRQGQMGYAKRDQALAAQKEALLRKMQSGQSGNYMSPEYLRGQ